MTSTTKQKSAIGRSSRQSRKVGAGRIESLIPERAVAICSSTAVSSTSGNAKIGGDYADTFVLPNGNVAIGVWDASGHGDDAAANMMLVRAGLRAFISVNADIVTTMVALNRVLFRQAANAMPWPFVAGFFGIVDAQSRCLKYVSCGHETAILFNASGGHRHLPHNSPLLGVSGEASFQEDLTCVEPGDMLVVVTDGITDARPITSKAEFFGSRRVCSLFRARDNDSEVTAAAVMAHTVAYSDGALNDDAAVLITRFT